MWSRFANGLMIDTDNWRAGLLTLILRVTVFFGFLVYLPSFYFAIKFGLVGVAVIDTVALLAIIGLFYFDQISFRLRATAFCLTLYVLAVGLLVWVGSISQIYLFGFSIFTAILLGLRAGLIAVLLSSATLLLVGCLGYVASEMAIPDWSEGFSGWVVITLNFTLVNTMLTLAIAGVIGAMNNALNRAIAARAALDLERTLLRTLIDAVPDVVFTKDTEGRIVNCNPATLALAGREREEQLAGVTVFDLYPRELAEKFHADDLRVISGQPLLNREERSLDRFGNPVWHSTIKVPLRDVAGEIVGLVGISRDITARKQAEAEYLRLLTRLQIQIERMPLAYLLCDADMRFTRWNPVAERMFGFSEAEIIGKHPFETIVPAESQAFVTGVFDKITAGHMDAHGVYANRTKGGGTITCEWHNTPLFDEDGTFAGLFSLAQDVTDRKILEEQLRQSQKMEAVGQLAGGIAHDFNNLLTVINGYSELLLGDMSESNDWRESVSAIRESGERAAGLTSQLLAFSRQTVLIPRVLDLNEVIADTGKMLARLIGEDIRLSTSLDPRIGQVKVDPGQFGQVLMNLAVNARDAMPTGGELTIKTLGVNLDEAYAAGRSEVRTGRYVITSVTDTGQGMAPEVMARVFEPFFTTKGEGKGTGLGLATVYGIVRQSGGHVEVHSEVGTGTTFKIYLPIVTGEERPEAGSETGIIRGGTESVLLVEDQVEVRRIALIALQTKGYTVVEAADGQEALRLIERDRLRFDILVTDVVMPGMNGRVLAEAVSRICPGIKVLYMSGYTDDAVVRHGLLQASIAFLRKPFTPMSLARKVRETLDQK
ncbi:PAS domain S-box protein [Zavarzinella formosa]|uniref:PAS domain S-box protein n=1 Tax=Zavarzinella formosa TaxID=360055 RepID=UPI0002E55BA2|nr:PAS domain S-box protein [Zavarzinella formosa]